MKTEDKNRQALIDAVIENLKESGFKYGDYTVLEELLTFIPSKYLVGALPESEWGMFGDNKISMKKIADNRADKYALEKESVIFRQDGDAGSHFLNGATWMFTELTGFDLNNEE